jgi:hypothetical protein
MLKKQFLPLPILIPSVVEPVPSYFTDWAIESAESSFVYKVSQKQRSIFRELTVSVILSKEVYMYMRPIANGFRDELLRIWKKVIVV